MQNDIYDVSVSLSDTQTFRKNKFNDEDDGSIHVSGLYKKKIYNALAYIGGQIRQVDADQKQIIAAGARTIYKEALIDTNFAVDQSGEAAAQLTTRKNIKGWDVIGNGLMQTNAYTPNGESASKTTAINASARRSFQVSPRSKINLFSSNSYSKNSNDLSQFSSQLGTSYYLNGFNVSNNLNYNLLKSDKLENDRNLNNNFSLRANRGNIFFRGGLSYNLLPHSEINNYLAQINYQPSLKFSGDIAYSYQPQNKYSNLRLNLNHNNDYFRISPFVEYDSNKDLYAGVNMNFSVVDTPDDALPTISSDRLIGKGLVSSLVYHDKNGNMVFDENDEALPDVIVKSIHIKRYERTNERGYSLINNLPTNRATDITVDPTTLPDSFMITANKGISVLPEAGEVIELQFPIHISGEIDGTVSVLKEEGSLQAAKRAKIDLHPLDVKNGEVIQTQSALDGFFVASQIPPGRYLMNVSDDTVKRYKSGTPMPKIIHIGHDGDTFYGEDIKLDQDKPYIPINVSYTNKNQDNQGQKSSESFQISTKSQGVSRLSHLLDNYAKKIADQSVYTGMQPIAQPNSQSKRYKLPENTIEASYDRCQRLSSKAIPCALEVVVSENF